jgi:hypothetical protein
MIRIKTKKQKIERLTKHIDRIEEKLFELRNDYYGSFFGGTNGTRTNINQNTQEIDVMRKRLSVLEEIVRESGLITDFNDDEVKIREDRHHGLFGGTATVNVPYQINKVKTVG